MGTTTIQILKLRLRGILNQKGEVLKHLTRTRILKLVTR